MAYIDFDIDFVCENCKESLDADWREGKKTVYVKPCENCISNSYEKGKEEGEKSNG